MRGTSDDLITNPSKNEFCINLDQARSEFAKIKGEILVPKFIGVYQARSTTSKMNELEEATFFSIRENLKNKFETKIAIETAKLIGKDATTLQPSMISVLYDPKQETPDLVNFLFNDPLQRISVYSINEVPNFREKDSSLKELIIGNIREIVRDKNLYDEQIRLIKTNIALMEKDRKNYGLTLDEWVFLYNSKSLWSDESNIREQKKMIKELRKTYKKITNDD